MVPDRGEGRSAVGTGQGEAEPATFRCHGDTGLRKVAAARTTCDGVDRPKYSRAAPSPLRARGVMARGLPAAVQWRTGEPRRRVGDDVEAERRFRGLLAASDASVEWLFLRNSEDIFDWIRYSRPVQLFDF